MKILEDISNFDFELKWVAGKTYNIADALSRVSVFGPKEQLRETEEEGTCLKISGDLNINIIAVAAGDIEYQQLVIAHKQAAEPTELDANHPDQHFREKGHELCTLQLEENKEPLIIKN